ncbi:hypothetical protein Tco_0401752 [Tanacetum coccineum]
MGLLTMDDGIVNCGEHTEAEETNHALMAISSSNDVTLCSKTCIDSCNTLKTLCDEQLNQLGDQEAQILAYSQAVKKLEAQLVTFQKQQLSLNEKLTFQANEIYEKDEKLKRYRRIGMKAVKEKEQLQKTVDSWKDSSKNLWRLIDSGMSSSSKLGLGYEIKSNNEVLSYEEEMNFSVFKCSKEDSIGKPSYSRFTKTNDFKGVRILWKYLELSLRTGVRKFNEHMEMSKSRLDVTNEKDVFCSKSKKLEPILSVNWGVNGPKGRPNASKGLGPRETNFLLHVQEILKNDTLSVLGKFDGKSDEGFLVGYSLNSKAYRVYNLVTKRVEVNLHVNFLEDKPNVKGVGYRWMFDIDYLTDSMNYIPVSLENQANPHAGASEVTNSAGTSQTPRFHASKEKDEDVDLILYLKNQISTKSATWL